MQPNNTNQIEVSAVQEMTMQARVIRADGRVEELGTIVGGNLPQRIAAYFRIKRANRKVAKQTTP